MITKYKITKKEAVKYVILFFLFLSVSMITMIVDNIFWITGSPEWDSSHKVSNVIDTWEGPVKEYSFMEKVDYVIGFRIFGVLTNYRDYVATIIISLFMLGFVMFSNEIIGKRVFSKSFIE